ncbi:MAG: hypothetical protein IJG51_11840 [Synergistaceae bacterium]|nr:hypothetical protein [Synergistaceae bacterium]MBQ6665886.1 hypothetical protein [Synergistaceae bacterium]
MTRKQILAMVRKLIADEQATGFTEGGNLEEPEGTQELENYLNRAVDEYSKRQAGLKDVRLVKETNLSDGAKLPDDYLSFCGAIPVRVIGNKIKYYVASASPLAVRYFARLPYVTAYGENTELPYESDQSIAISALAAIYALDKQEADISQHLMLMGYGANGTNQPA